MAPNRKNHRLSSPLVTVANIITLLRLGLLAVLIVLVIQHRLTSALLVFALAWSLDVVDGYVARRFKQETRLGFILDKVVDRLLLITAGIVLINQGYLPPLALLLFTKDVVALPALHLQLMANEKLQDLGTAGKLMTVVQGLALLWLVLIGTFATPIIFTVAIGGGVIGTWYFYRVVSMRSEIARK